ncbi:MAG TPA: TIGR01212 family radical SAM protein [Prolixibacteraceae bacterium]|nr:TIGR01212 family radical SAM protein [Prolixibacteraceae bacterium]
MNEADLFFPWGHAKRYNDFPSHFRLLFSERIQKVSIDAGFTCPNRDGTKGFGGCIYCNNRSFQPDYCRVETRVARQVEEGIHFFEKKYASMKYLAYFQAYTNTYAPIDVLKKVYHEALQHPKIVGLVVATRPDCLSDEVLDYLQSLAEKRYVMVELGIESCHNETLKTIHRGHSFEDSAKALEMLAERRIHNCAHMILGLPGENRELILQQPRILSELPVENLKLHQLQILHNTPMARLYDRHPERFVLFHSPDEYVELVVDYLELLRPSIIIERFVSQSPAKMILAPGWGMKNFEFVAKVEKRLSERDTFQGQLYKNPGQFSPSNS